MQKRTALAVTALLLGAQFALVQNSRGDDDVQPQTGVDTEGSYIRQGKIQLESPTAPEVAGSGSRSPSTGATRSPTLPAT